MYVILNIFKCIRAYAQDYTLIFIKVELTIFYYEHHTVIYCSQFAISVFMKFFAKFWGLNLTQVIGLFLGYKTHPEKKKKKKIIKIILAIRSLSRRPYIVSPQQNLSVQYYHCGACKVDFDHFLVSFRAGHVFTSESVKLTTPGFWSQLGVSYAKRKVILSFQKFWNQLEKFSVAQFKFLPHLSPSGVFNLSGVVIVLGFHGKSRGLV